MNSPRGLLNSVPRRWRFHSSSVDNRPTFLFIVVYPHGVGGYLTKLVGRRQGLDRAGLELSISRAGCLDKWARSRYNNSVCASVAQRIRVPDFGSGGRGFESLRGYFTGHGRKTCSSCHGLFGGSYPSPYRLQTRPRSPHSPRALRPTHVPKRLCFSTANRSRGARFFKKHRSATFASSALRGPMSNAFRKAVDAFIEDNRVSFITFANGFE